MKNVLLFGASGNLGRRIVQSMAGTDWNITAFVRPVSDTSQLQDTGANLIYGDVNNEEDVARAFSTHYQLVISSLGPSDTKLSSLFTGMVNIVRHFKAQRLIAVGAAGILPDDDYGVKFRHPHFPPFLNAIASQHFNAYSEVAVSGINYLYVCPPRMLPGSFADSYKLFVEKPLPSVAATVSFEACAAFIAKEAREARFHNQRIGICI